MHVSFEFLDLMGTQFESIYVNSVHVLHATSEFLDLTQNQSNHVYTNVTQICLRKLNSFTFTYTQLEYVIETQYKYEYANLFK